MSIITGYTVGTVKSDNIFIKTIAIKTIKNTIRCLGWIIMINMRSHWILFIIRGDVRPYFQKRFLGKDQIKKNGTEYQGKKMTGFTQKILTLFTKYKYLD